VDMSIVHVKSQYWSYEAATTASDVADFLRADLDVSRLDRIHDLLWWAGRQVPPRAIHRLHMLGRRIVVTEQADLHLVWSSEAFLIKPLPDFLLNHAFWEAHICGSPDLYPGALGFLFSYIWLVRYKSDFEMAKRAWLLPQKLSWVRWKAFVASVCASVDPNRPGPVGDRYRYGELRVSRLDQIYRFAPRFRFRHLVRGYHYNYSSYGRFFRREFAWLVAAFAYISIILSAMQVGLATPQLQGNDAFTSGSFGFAALSIIFPVVITGFVAFLYVALWLYHVTTTLCHYLYGKRREEKEKGSGFGAS